MDTFWGNFWKNWITFLFQHLVAVNFQSNLPSKCTNKWIHFTTALRTHKLKHLLY